MNPVSQIFSKLWQCTLPKEKPQNYYEEIVPNIPYRQGIPKHVYQTFPTKNLPKEAKENVEKMKEINPGWTFHLYDDNDIEQFLLKHYGKKILEYYRRIDPSYGAAKADFFRYMLIYVTGGVYLDYKSSITKPLDNFLLHSDGFILSHWDNREGEPHEGVGSFDLYPDIPRGEYMQWFIIASPGHPFLRKIITNMLQRVDRYNPFIDNTGSIGVFFTTGPALYTYTLKKVSEESQENNFRWVELITDWGFRYSIYEIPSDTKKTGFIKSKHRSNLTSNYVCNGKAIIRHTNAIIQNMSYFYIIMAAKIYRRLRRR